MPPGGGIDVARMRRDPCLVEASHDREVFTALRLTAASPMSQPQGQTSLLLASVPGQSCVDGLRLAPETKRSRPAMISLPLVLGPLIPGTAWAPCSRPPPAQIDDE